MTRESLARRLKKDFGECAPHVDDPTQTQTRELFQHQRWVASGGRFGARLHLEFGVRSGRRKFNALDLDGVDFSKASITRTDFDFSDLRQARFRGAALKDVTFKNCDLEDADFTGAMLENVSFEVCPNLHLAHFEDATMVEERHETVATTTHNWRPSLTLES